MSSAIGQYSKFEKEYATAIELGHARSATNRHRAMNKKSRYHVPSALPQYLFV
jgi:hypothetical protein